MLKTEKEVLNVFTVTTDADGRDSIRSLIIKKEGNQCRECYAKLDTIFGAYYCPSARKTFCHTCIKSYRTKMHQFVWLRSRDGTEEHSDFKIDKIINEVA